jgi:hypothetical protein
VCAQYLIKHVYGSDPKNPKVRENVAAIIMKLQQASEEQTGWWQSRFCSFLLPLLLHLLPLSSLTHALYIPETAHSMLKCVMAYERERDKAQPAGPAANQRSAVLQWLSSVVRIGEARLRFKDMMEEHRHLHRSINEGHGFALAFARLLLVMADRFRSGDSLLADVSVGCVTFCCFLCFSWL